MSWAVVILFLARLPTVADAPAGTFLAVVELLSES
jgi:hypothetical protein